MSLNINVVTPTMAIVASDTAISTEINGEHYRVNNNGQKIFIVGNNVIFSSGDADISKIIMDDYISQNNKSLDNLRDIIKLWCNRSIKFRPGLKDKVDNGYIINCTIVVRFEHDQIVMYSLSPKNDYIPEKIVCPPNKHMIQTNGVYYVEAGELMNSVIGSGKSIYEGLLETYDTLSDGQIGGKWEAWQISKNGVQKVFSKQVKEKESMQWIPRSAYENTDSIKHYLAMQDALHTEAIIQGSKLIIGHDDAILKMFPDEGLWLGDADFNEAPFRVNLQGEATMTKLTLKNREGKTLLETDDSNLYLDNMNIIGVGRLSAESIAVNTIVAGQGVISNLTVKHLMTIGRDAEVGEYLDYIDVQDNYIKYISAKVATKDQATDNNGNLLYWTDADRSIITTNETPYTAFSYGFDEAHTFVKQIITFDGTGSSATPLRIIGVGDGVTSNSAKVVESKYAGGFKTTYYSSNTAKERTVDLKDNGILINAAEGVSIELLNDGQIKIKSTSKMTFDAPEYDFL